MKKSLIALAVLGAVSGAASAQSSVTMYGIVDIGVQYNERGTNIGTTAAPVFSQESMWGIDSGNQSGSRLGVRGSEAPRPQLERGIRPRDGLRRRPPARRCRAGACSAARPMVASATRPPARS